MSRPRGEVWLSPWGATRADFDRYGVGVRLYFDFLLSVAAVFLALAALGLLLTVACVTGVSPHVQHVLAAASIGHLGDCGLREEHCDTLADKELRLLGAAGPARGGRGRCWRCFLVGILLAPVVTRVVYSVRCTGTSDSNF